MGAAGSVTLGPGAEISTVIEVPEGSSASEVAAEFRSEHFSALMLHFTNTAIGDEAGVSGALSIGQVSVQPLAFTTSTSTATTTTTVEIFTTSVLGTSSLQSSTTRDAATSSM